MSTGARKFEARYPGRCRACPDPIEVGDDLVMTDEGAVHFGCAGDRAAVAARVTMPREVCPRCFTEKAVNGACACEDPS